MRDSLFRQEVLDEQKNRMQGQVLIQLPGIAHGLFWFFCALFSVVLLFLVFGRSSRREQAIGILVPDRGAIKIQVHRTGLLNTIHVSEGQSVEKNQVLFTLGSDRILPTGIEANEASMEELRSLIENLKARITSLPERQEMEMKRLMIEEAELTRKLTLMKTQTHLVAKRLQLKQDRKRRSAALAEERLISINDFQEIDDAVIKAQNDLKDTEKAVIAIERAQQELAIQKALLPDEFQKQEVELLQQLAAAKEQLLNFNLEKSQQIVAPVNGRITSMQAYPGMNLDPDKPLAVLLPEGSQLQAHLFVPGRAAGFIREGQKVLMQYEAFPAAKFGVQVGHIKEISRSALHSREIQEMDLPGKDEAYYRLTVNLLNESVHAFGQEFPLQSGMKAKADIILESRTLMEWIFEPLLRAGS